ncbi:alcohol oxidase-like protein [Coniochaeta sp. 2T2.1]|nr:alcohol oxidase-like protein [Coniochaeta sp. 2T2.1]
MGIYTQLPSDLEIDVIIAGGGTAGCVVAGRLAAADPNLSILVIEGGQDNYDNPSVVYPALFLDNLAPTSKTTIFYPTTTQPQLAGRQPVVAAGGVLGGGSSINFAMYTRAQREDYDAWDTPGWSTTELLPFFKKLETYHGQGDPAVHGFEGPVQISDGGYRAHRVTKDFIEGANKIGYPFVHDLCDLDSNNAVAPFMRYSSPDGKRQDAAHCYLHPLLRDGKHPNLHVLVETQVVRVLFDDNKRAIGVEFVPNPNFHPTVAPVKDATPPQTIRARKLVILSAGAVGTPGVLERSGVGNKDILAKAGVPLVAEVPGVGASYEDHHLVLWPYKTALGPDETNDAIVSGRLDRNVAIAEKQRRMGWNFVDVAVKARPSQKDVAKFDPTLKAAWDRDFANHPNRPLLFFTLVEVLFGDPSAFPPGQYVSPAIYTAYPYSRGHVHITGTSLADPLDFNLGIFSDEGEVDLKKQVWGYKKHRELMRRTRFYRGEVAASHPKFPAGSKAAVVDLDIESKYDPDGIVADIEYTAKDDEAIEQALREAIGTCWHSLGTVRMAPKEKNGGVDASLNVYGVSGLKVVDLSIVPRNVAANTCNTAFMVGEKGADIILRELGIAQA